MTERDTDARETPEGAGPRDRASRLAAAILGISASLDVDTVVRKVVEEARSLTGAQRGIIATIDESGAPGEFFFSGYTDEEQRELLAWPHALELFAHFRELPGPLRQEDFADYARALGLTPLANFSMAFPGTPMRHRETNAGYFFLGDKAGGEGRLTTKGAREMRAAFAKTILVVDEGSLASTVQTRDLLRIAAELRMPRVVLVGDARQLDAVDAGKPFAQLQAAGMPTATMDEIMRQRDPVLKEAVVASLKGDIGNPKRRSATAAGAAWTSDCDDAAERGPLCGAVAKPVDGAVGAS